MYLYEYGDNIDNKRYYYEVYIEEDPNKQFEGIRVELVLRKVKPFSRIIFHLEKDEVVNMLDKTIEKIVEKHYKAHIKYKG